MGTSITFVDLSGPETINGDMRIANGVTLSLLSTSIKTISGTLSISNASYLSTLSLGSLTSVGSLEMRDALQLSELGFDSGITSAETVHIENTFLSSLDGLSLTEVVDLNLTSNGRLLSADLPLVKVTGTLSLIDNGQRFVVNLSDLVSVNDFYISNTTEILLPSLQTISGVARIDTNYFESISAPVLQTCDNGLSIVNNPDLDRIVFGQLSSVTGSLLIANNSNVNSIDGLDVLKTISDNVDLRGNFFV